MSGFQAQQLTKEQREHYCRKFLEKRQLARTDLFYLCNEVLAPPTSKIMVPHAHGPIVDHFQKFKGWTEVMDPKTLRVVLGSPNVALWDLEGPRDTLLLVSRGHLKTSIDIGHIIQWIINYPDVRVLLATATGDQSERMVKEIKGHFQFNPRFRWLFPEFCPPAKRAADFGSASEFTVPNRTRKELKEPTVMTASVGKTIASTHHEVVKADDAVTEATVKTPGQIQDTKDFFGYLEPLRERGPSKDGRPNPGWKDVIGTIYDFNDYHQMVVDHAEKHPGQWKITRQSCWVDKAKRIPLWPERFPAAELDRILNSPEVGPFIFSSQYELHPIPQGTGLATKDQIKFFDAKLVKQLIPRYRVSTTVDLADMNPNSPGDFVVFTVAGRDREGKLDVLSIQRKRYSLEDVIEMFFTIQRVYPQNIKFKVQKDHFARVLEPVMKREMAKRGVYLWIEYIPISTNISKVQKIQGLQAWFSMGLIRFADSITCKSDLIDEILRFPKGAHDDILDTLSDHMHDKDGKADDVIPHPREVSPEVEHFGFNPYGETFIPNESECYAEVTGL